MTFTTGSWNTAQTVTVAAVDDGVTEGEESVTLTHGVVGADSATEYAGVAGESVIVTVTDPAGVTVSPTSLDVVEGDTGSYEVVLTAAPTAAVVVEVDGHTTGGDVTVDGSASAVLLTFTTGSWNTAQTVTVAAVDDGVTEGEESVTLTHGVVGADSATEYVGVAGESVIVTVTDPAGVSVSPTSLDVVEGASGTYEVVLTAAPTSDVVVEVDGHTTGGDVTVDGSASAVSLTFTTGSWNTAQTVTVAAVDDGVTEGEESVTLTHGVVGADSATEYVGVAGESVIVTVTDPAGVTVSPTMLDVVEGASGTYEVVLTAAPTSDVVVEVDGHTTGGDVTVDGSASAVLLTFTTGSWNTAQTVTVAAVDDGVTEGEESVTLTHAVVGADSATEYVGVAGESVIVTVTDPAGVTVSPTSLNITEGASDTYTVVLTSEPTADVVVEIDGHTTGGVVTVDGSSSVVALTFTTGDWNTAQTETVAAVDNSVAGGEESVSLTHAVVDADSATEYAGVTGESVAVTVTDDETAGVTVSPTTLNITEGASGSYTVVLTSEPTADVVVEIDGHTTDGVVTVDGSSSVVSLTFTTASWNTAQTVTVAAVDDSTAGGTESVSLTHAVKDADSATEYAGVTGAPVTVTVTDNDSAGVTVNPMTLNITEGASGSYTVELTSEPTGDVVVEIGGHTTGGVVTVDGSSSVVELTFTTASWDTAQTVTVAAVDDSTAGGTESVSLTHAVVDTDSATEYAGVTGASVTVTVTDNDSAGVTVSPTSLSITEGASGSYSVELTSEPTGDVVVEIGGHTTGGVVTVDGSSSVVELTFTTASWDTAQTVTVAAVDDSVAEGEESVSLTHAVVDADSATEYAGVAGESVAVTVTDDETAGVTVSPTSLNITEGASDTYTVVLTSEPTADVVVEIAGHTTGGVVTVDGSSTVVALTFTTASWNTAQTVTVAAVDDSTAGGTESVTLTHAVKDADSAAEYGAVTVGSVTVTVTDNDSAGVTVSFEKDFHRTSEGASGAFATVRLSAAPQQEVTIPINVSSTTTAEANDYRLSTDPFQGDPNYAAVPTSGTFDVTFEVGDSAAYFAIRALPDTVFENDETVVLEFGTLPSGVSTGSPSATTFHLIDTQTASFGAASYSATEGGPGATVTVNLDYAVSAIVCLEVENHAGTSDGDYAGVPDDLVFAGTETSRSFVVTVADDADSEGGSITIGLGCLSGELREGSPSSTTVILLDDDPPGGDPPGGDPGGDSLPAPRGFTASYVTLDGNYYNKTQDSVTLLWWPLDRAVRYKLEYRRTTGGGDWTIVAGDFEEYTGGGNGPVAVAAGLECDTEYDFRLSAAGVEDTDVSGFGAYAETQARTGPCPESEMVTNILVATTPACATLHWTAPLDGRAVAYRVRRTDLGQEPAVTTTLTASTAGTTFRHCPPGGYPPGSGYLFWVAALTAGGEVYGEHNSQIEATGPKGPPSVARNLRFTRQSPQVRSLAWDPPVNHWLTTVSEATDGDGYSNEVADPWVSYVVQRGELEPGSVPGHETLVGGTWRDLGEVTGTTFTDRENIGGRIFVYRVLAKNLNGFAVGYHPEIWMERPTTSLQRRDAPDVGGLQESDTPPQLQTAEFQENSEVPALPPLTAGYRDAPVSHDGQGSFTFELRFSEEVELSYVTLRDEAFRVTGGTVITARRLNSPSNIRWRIEIQPAPDGDVTVLLPGTTDCGAEGAVCTEDGRKLSNGLALVVSGPA